MAPLRTTLALIGSALIILGAATSRFAQAAPAPDAPSAERNPMEPSPTTSTPLIPDSHHGRWRGENRLWVTDPANPFRSAGILEAEGHEVRYTWRHEGEDHAGTLRLSGPPAALRADWTDSWHAADGMTLHGLREQGVLRLFGTYAAGDGPAWGWQMELDARDPEALVLRMFNVMPGWEPVPAVVLSATR